MCTEGMKELGLAILKTNVSTTISFEEVLIALENIVMRGQKGYFCHRHIYSLVKMARAIASIENIPLTNEMVKDFFDME